MVRAGGRQLEGGGVDGNGSARIISSEEEDAMAAARAIEGDGSTRLSRDFATVEVYRSQRGNQGSDVC